MHSKRIRLGLLACASFLVVLSAGAISPPAAPTPLPTPLPVPTAVPTQTINPDESLPVVINYGQGQETRVQIYRGVMDAVGLLRNQVVTVTISLPVSRAGEPVKVGLYDGGLAGPAADPLSQNIITVGNPGGLIPPVSVNGNLQFNFQSGNTLGLYRVLLTVGSRQYLLRFYAGIPRPISTPVPTPNFVPKD